MNSGTVNKYQVPIWRTLVVYGFIVMVVGAIVFRLVSLQVLQNQEYVDQAVDNYTIDISEPATRGIILTAMVTCWRATSLPIM